MQLLSLVFTEARPVLQEVFHHVLLGFVLFGSPLFHFSNSSSNFRTVSLFCFLSLTFYGISDKFTVFLYLLICATPQSSHCTVFFSLLSWFVGKKMPSLLIVSQHM